MDDILFDNSNDLLIGAGDLELGNSNEQNKYMLLACSSGEYKEFPFVGCGLRDFINENSPENMFTQIRKQFDKDGLSVKSISYKHNKLNIDANY
ncbi:MAG: hypothetical protein N4A49_06750 [Marinifilaceae bacterium]|jgi:hypothetical protein|nr:hypothetical protein [Marinifilaceae bacterium]